MHFTLFRVVPVALVIALLTVLYACGDDDDGAGGTGGGNGDAAEELTLGEYFGELDGIFEQADTETDDALEELTAAGEEAEGDLEAEIEALDVFLASSIATFEAAISAMDDLRPPDEVSGAHGDFVDAVGEAIELSQQLREDLGGVETREEADALIDSFDEESSATVDRGDEACLELQSAADANDIDVDLDCED